MTERFLAAVAGMRVQGDCRGTPKTSWIDQPLGVRALYLNGAEEVNRTPDLLITNQLLYRLSYFGDGCEV